MLGHINLAFINQALEALGRYIQRSRSGSVHYLARVCVYPYIYFLRVILTEDNPYNSEYARHAMKYSVPSTIYVTFPMTSIRT